MYSTKDLAIIIPTKNRPHLVMRLLNSLKEQETCGRIIIVASGVNIRDTVMEFENNLPVEYYHSEISGQIKQRNIGIHLLDSRTRLVSSLDDDLTFCKDAISNMISFWNSVEKETAGVGFNIVNTQSHFHSWLRGILGFSVPEAGQVLKSGINTAITNVSSDISTTWLNGGATVWRQSILKKYPHREIRSHWAICEDLIYSYPLSKFYPMYISYKAQVKIEDLMDHTSPHKIIAYRAKTLFLWQLYFVHTNLDLSIFHFLKNKFLEILYQITLSLIKQDFTRLQYVKGMQEGIWLGLITLIKRKDLILTIEKHCS